MHLSRTVLTVIVLFSAADFTMSTRTVTVPTSPNIGTQTFQFPEFFRVIDDNINEMDQIFVLAVEIGPDVSIGSGCFLLAAERTECFGRHGATRIIIKDNDRKHYSLSSNSAFHTVIPFL